MKRNLKTWQNRLTEDFGLGDGKESMKQALGLGSAPPISLFAMPMDFNNSKVGPGQLFGMSNMSTFAPACMRDGAASTYTWSADTVSVESLCNPLSMHVVTGSIWQPPIRAHGAARLEILQRGTQAHAGKRGRGH